MIKHLKASFNDALFPRVNKYFRGKKRLQAVSSIREAHSVLGGCDDSSWLAASGMNKLLDTPGREHKDPP